MKIDKLFRNLIVNCKESLCDRGGLTWRGFYIEFS